MGLGPIAPAEFVVTVELSVNGAFLAAFVLDSVSYALDGAPIFTKTDTDGDLDGEVEIELFNGSIVPGNHNLSVNMVYRGSGYGVFSYLKGYVFRIRSSYAFTAEDRAASLDARRLGSCVRLEVSRDTSESLRTFLKTALAVEEDDVFDISGPLDLSALMRLADLRGFDEQRYDAWPPQPSPEIEIADDVFEVVSRHDVLLCHPFESFEPVQRLVEQAADDPDVLAIKQVLYRTSRNSPIVAALHRAARGEGSPPRPKRGATPRRARPVDAWSPAGRAGTLPVGSMRQA